MIRLVVACLLCALPAAAQVMGRQTGSGTENQSVPQPGQPRQPPVSQTEGNAAANPRNQPTANQNDSLAEKSQTNQPGNARDAK